MDPGHGLPGRGEDPRQHGDRPQRPARPVGLDARPEDPLDHLGLGPRVAPGAVEARPQHAAPHVHEHHRPGQRPRLRHHARGRGPALEAALPGAAAVELRERLHLRVRHRDVRHRVRRAPSRQARLHPGAPLPRQEGGGQGQQADHQGLRPLPRALRSRTGGAPSPRT